MGNLAKAIQQRLSKLVEKKHHAKLEWYREKFLKIKNDTELKTISIDGLLFYYKLRFTMFHTYPEIFVREIYKFNPQNRVPVIIDCGANIGLSALYFAKHYPQANIICYEPDEDNFQVLNKNIHKNFPDYPNIQLKKEAVWNEDGEISFFSNGTEASSIVAQDNDSNIVRVKAVRLKDILNEYESIDFLKMDIEGAEYEVIKDCKDELKKINNLFLEYHGLANETNKLNELIEAVKNADFSAYITLAADSIRRPFADKKSTDAFDVQLNIFCYRN